MECKDGFGAGAGEGAVVEVGAQFEEAEARDAVVAEDGEELPGGAVPSLPIPPHPNQPLSLMPNSTLKILPSREREREARDVKPAASFPIFSAPSLSTRLRDNGSPRHSGLLHNAAPDRLSPCVCCDACWKIRGRRFEESTHVKGRRCFH